MANRWAPWSEQILKTADQDFTLKTKTLVTVLQAVVTAKIATQLTLLWILDVLDVGTGADGVIGELYAGNTLIQTGPTILAAAEASNDEFPYVAGFSVAHAAGATVTYALSLRLINGATTFRVGGSADATKAASRLLITGMPSEGVTF